VILVYCKLHKIIYYCLCEFLSLYYFGTLVVTVAMLLHLIDCVIINIIIIPIIITILMLKLSNKQFKKLCYYS